MVVITVDPSKTRHIETQINSAYIGGFCPRALSSTKHNRNHTKLYKEVMDRAGHRVCCASVGSRSTVPVERMTRKLWRIPGDPRTVLNFE